VGRDRFLGENSGRSPIKIKNHCCSPYNSRFAAHTGQLEHKLFFSYYLFLLLIRSIYIRPISETVLERYFYVFLIEFDIRRTSSKRNTGSFVTRIYDITFHLSTRWHFSRQRHRHGHRRFGGRQQHSRSRVGRNKRTER